MKLSNLKALALMVFAGIFIAACGGIGKMAKNADTVNYKLDPNPLIVRGDSVELNINGSFPAKYFSKKAMVELTPTLKYEGGSTPYEMAAYQGEDAVGNATVIPFETGKTVSYTDKVAYTPAMETSELYLEILGKQGKKEKQFEPYKLADGVITTPFLVESDDMPIIAADKFQRVTNHKSEAVIHYLVNSSVVRSGELTDADMKAMKGLIATASKNDAYAFKGATILAYASPEGEITLNDNLADERAASAKKAVSNILKQNKVTFDADAFFNLQPKGEDWIGFKQKMEASNIADKALILRILEMYSDLNKREEEVKNLAATYTEIREVILPELRRSQIDLNYQITGRTDAEILAMARSANADSLSIEEMLYAATLTEDMNEQMSFYKKASEVYPEDYRAFNNMGVIDLKKNDLSGASAMFTKANTMTANPVSKNNMGIIDRLNGNRKGAMKLLEEAAGAGNEVNYNMGIIDIQNGDYNSAVQNMATYNTFNKALAQVLMGNNDAAKKTLSESNAKDTAMGLYLKAIIGARSNDASMVSASLKNAYSLDASLKAKAAKDLEFRNFQEEIK